MYFLEKKLDITKISVFKRFYNLEKSPLKKYGKRGACIWSEPKKTNCLRQSISFWADGREGRQVTTPVSGATNSGSAKRFGEREKRG